MPIVYQSNPRCVHIACLKAAVVEAKRGERRACRAPPQAAPLPVADRRGRKVRLAADDARAFHRRVPLNGRSVAALVDTGATAVALNAIDGAPHRHRARRRPTSSTWSTPPTAGARPPSSMLDRMRDRPDRGRQCGGDGARRQRAAADADRHELPEPADELPGGRATRCCSCSRRVQRSAITGA